MTGHWIYSSVFCWLHFFTWTIWYWYLYTKKYKAVYIYHQVFCCPESVNTKRENPMVYCTNFTQCVCTGYCKSWILSSLPLWWTLGEMKVWNKIPVPELARILANERAPEEWHKKLNRLFKCCIVFVSTLNVTNCIIICNCKNNFVGTSHTWAVDARKATMCCRMSDKPASFCGYVSNYKAKSTCE